MKITEYIKENSIYLDGGMGTLLQSAGLGLGELPEMWNLTHSDVIEKIHRDYFNAGSNVVSTNTFGANSLKFDDDELSAIIKAAVDNAKRARDTSSYTSNKWIALDIGPLGRMLKPYGDLDFEDAVAIFAKTVRIGAKAGVDLIFIETMSDSYETRAALLAAKENSSLPVFVSNAYGEDGKLMTGASPAAMIAMLEGMGADAIGVNCSLGPKALFGVVQEYAALSSVPVIFKPNAGLPCVEKGRTVYNVSPEEFADDVAEMLSIGVRAIGGCCGTTPEYIKRLVLHTTDNIPRPIEKKNISLVSSYTHAVVLGERPVIIGERINPTGKPRLKEALRSGNMDYILREGLAQQTCGADVLDVNVGLPEIDEVEMLSLAVTELQAVTDLPLQIDTANVEAMEAALRRYNGKAMINSVNGKRESMEKIFPLVKKYGGVVVALTLDEGGIPKTAEGRLEIARKILSVANEFGIDKKDIIFDPLAMAVSADENAAKETLRSVELITHELGCHTSLGVSNVSFGLPMRDALNSSFFTVALSHGLSAAIVNPHSFDIMKSYHSYLALMGLDNNFDGFIKYAETIPAVNSESSIQVFDKKTEKDCDGLFGAIVKGLRDSAQNLTQELLKSTAPLDVVNTHIIPALNTVGEGFEKKSVYLPALLMSAETAKAAFEVIKASMTGDSEKRKCIVVLATVKGDIHDIGKNIVKLLLENYGFEVVDLGCDVSAERIVDAAEKSGASIVGLSALMTTTAPEMEEVVKLIKQRELKTRVMVGGAVLTKDYADKIGADFYGKDAMAAVRFVQLVESEA